MRVVSAAIEAIRVPLRVPYRIAGATCTTADIVCLTLRDENGAPGYGTASPVPGLTGDRFEDVPAILEGRLLPLVIGRDMTGVGDAIDRAAEAAGPRRSALGALDMALCDLRARRDGEPLWRKLGGRATPLLTSVTLGIDTPDAMAAGAEAAVARGFRVLKLKVGEEAEGDCERLRRVREAVGPGIALRADANGGYSEEDARRVIAEALRQGVELFEQPVARGDFGALARLTAAADLPILADEDAGTASDVERLLRVDCVRGVNVKLMKCGGIREALRIDALLAEAGCHALVGCMDESRAGIAAAAHFATAARSVRWIDLDGHLDLASDPFEGGFEIRDGAIHLTDLPGLGVTPAGGV